MFCITWKAKIWYSPFLTLCISKEILDTMNNLIWMLTVVKRESKKLIFSNCVLLFRDMFYCILLNYYYNVLLMNALYPSSKIENINLHLIKPHNLNFNLVSLFSFIFVRIPCLGVCTILSCFSTLFHRVWYLCYRSLSYL